MHPARAVNFPDYLTEKKSKYDDNKQRVFGAELVYGDKAVAHLERLLEKIGGKKALNKNEKNVGDYPNRNKAASYAKGVWLINVDSDDKINEDGTIMLETSPGSYMKIEKSAISIEWTQNINKAAVVSDKK